MLKKFLKQQSEKRRFIRHPAEISIDYKISGQVQEHAEYTKNISFGGLCFQAGHPVELGTLLVLRFPSINPDMEVSGKVVWCTVKKERVLIGVEFLDENDAYRARIIEEICHIADFQKKSFAGDPKIS